jgi:hypothetical protein
MMYSLITLRIRDSAVSPARTPGRSGWSLNVAINWLEKSTPLFHLSSSVRILFWSLIVEISGFLQ